VTRSKEGAGGAFVAGPVQVPGLHVPGGLDRHEGDQVGSCPGERLAGGDGDAGVGGAVEQQDRRGQPGDPAGVAQAVPVEVVAEPGDGLGRRRQRRRHRQPEEGQGAAVGVDYSSFHAASQAPRPRRVNRRAPWCSLSCPNTGSTVCFRRV
jgi:hypothetical protein